MAAQSCFGFELADIAAVHAAVAEMKEKGQRFIHEARLEPWGQTVARFMSPEGFVDRLELCAVAAPARVSIVPYDARARGKCIEAEIYADGLVPLRRNSDRSYCWGDKALRLCRCANCGCVTHWVPVSRASKRMGVNFRNFDSSVIATTRVRHIDGAETWKFLD